MKKRLLASLMALCLIVGLLPTAVLAVEEPQDLQEETPVSEPVPTAAADGYTDWTHDDSLPTSGTYRLTTNVTIKPTFSDYATVKSSLVLDLAGHTVTVSDEAGGDYAYFVNSSNASLVIEDSVGGGRITNAGTTDRMSTLIQVNSGSFELKGGTLENTSSMGYALHLNSSSTATLSGGTVVNTASGGHAAFVNSSARLTMTDGEIRNTVDGGHAVYINTTAGFTMEGGTVTQESTYSSSAAIYSNSRETPISISGGEVESKSMGVYAAFAPVSVTGGAFRTDSYAFQTRYATIAPAEGNTVSVDSEGAVFYTFSESENQIVDGNFTAPALTKSYTQNDQPSTLAVSGGTFDIGKVASAGDNSQITISGGKFTSKVDDQYLEEGLTQGQDGTVGAQDDVSVAELWRDGEQISRHLTLEEALENAQNNDTVMLVAGKELSLTKPVEIINKSLTLDLHGSTIKAGNGFSTANGAQIISVKAGGNLTIMDSSADKSGVVSGAKYAVYVGGAGTKVVVQSGKLIGDGNAVLVTSGAALEVTGGTLTVANPATSTEPAIHVQLESSLKISGGVIVGGQGTNGGAVSALSSTVDLSGNAKLTGYSGIALFNVDSNYGLSNAPDAVSSALTMTGGAIEAKVFALSGNCLQSAGSVAMITGGSLTSTEGTAIYWPMEGALTIGGNAVVTGGTGIEAKMGTITIQNNAKVIGTAEYRADEPTNGGSSPEGSALLLSSQMYGTDGQYKTDNQLKVNITGGTLTSNQGNAVTVYNTEQNEVQTAQVTVSGGTFTAEKAAVISVTKGGNTVTTNGNTQTTSKSNTTLTVSGSVAPASIDANGSTAYFANVTQAIASLAPDATEKTQISVFGNSTISTDVELQENITLVVAPGVQLTADVTSGESEMVVITEQDANGNTVYKLVAKPENPEQIYVASITANGQTAYFDTLAAAVKTVQSGQTITLLKNSDAAETITISRAVTFTLDLKTFTMKDTIAAGSGFVLTRSGNTYTVSVYVPPVTPPGGGGSSGSSSSGDYIVSVDKTTHGKVTVSPSRADKGDTVTITVKPDTGDELDELTVTDKDGDEIKLTEKDDNKFTFKMPGSKVTVEASFKLIETEPENPFTDISKSDYFYDAVLWAADKGITSGVTDTLFAPNVSCTRAQMVTFLWRANGSPVVDYAMNFTDVPADAYYADAVCWAVSKGITSGTSATTFAPDMTVTRSQTVTFLYRAAGTLAVSGGSFADVDANAYYADAVAWAVAEGITSGTSATTFSPNAPCTRAQIVTFMYRDAQ